MGVYMILGRLNLIEIMTASLYVGITGQEENMY